MSKIQDIQLQQKILSHTRQKVIALFKQTPVPGHGIDHTTRVVNWVKIIAKGEKAKNPFLCELSAWFHDIGRTIEDNPGETSRKHHELSYQMLRKWFTIDQLLVQLTKLEKLELLYTVRYHWNNEANKYDTAWILRDADKMDGFGAVGLRRAKEVFAGNEDGWNQNFRNQVDCFVSVRTKTAKRLIEKNKMMEPIEREYKKFLRSKIERVEL
ncbi:MAG: HD domain-containing protein [Candidatus Magasanikbacteria bacterium]|nr:HD domain-containing protein [Candidatus Magasanikbacteria bacterium]